MLVFRISRKSSTKLRSSRLFAIFLISKTFSTDDWVSSELNLRWTRNWNLYLNNLEKSMKLRIVLDSNHDGKKKRNSIHDKRKEKLRIHRFHHQNAEQDFSDQILQRNITENHRLRHQNPVQDFSGQIFQENIAENHQRIERKPFYSVRWRNVILHSYMTWNTMKETDIRDVLWKIKTNLVLERNQVIIIVLIALIDRNVIVIALIKWNLDLEQNQVITTALIALIKTNLVLERNQTIMTALIKRNLVTYRLITAELLDFPWIWQPHEDSGKQWTSWTSSMYHEKTENFWQYLMTLRNLDHPGKMPSSQVHSGKIPFQHVQDTTTIHDTVFSFPISARTISVRTTTTLPDPFIVSPSLPLKGWIFSTRGAVVGSVLPGPSQKGPEPVRTGHTYIFLSR